jgi:hypothetical protein
VHKKLEKRGLTQLDVMISVLHGVHLRLVLSRFACTHGSTTSMVPTFLRNRCPYKSDLGYNEHIVDSCVHVCCTVCLASRIHSFLGSLNLTRAVQDPAPESMQRNGQPRHAEMDTMFEEKQIFKGGFFLCEWLSIGALTNLMRRPGVKHQQHVIS